MPFWKKKHNPDDVALVQDIFGHCNKCKHRGLARLTAYYSGEILIRCNNCKKAGDFIPDDDSWNNPQKYKPFLDNEDDDEGSGRYTRGNR